VTPYLDVNAAEWGVPVQAQGTTDVAGSVSVTNTPNVNVANTPSVNVANTPNVNVANTPSVNIANTPTVTLSGNSQVILTNGLGTAPLLVRDADHPARRIFQHSGPAGNDSFTVPDGKVLVIEWVSFDTPNTNNLGGAQVLYQIRNVAGGQSGLFSYKSDAPSSAASSLDFVANQQVRIYCDPGSTVSVTSRVPFSNNNAVGGYTISGYVVDVP